MKHSNSRVSKRVSWLRFFRSDTFLRFWFKSLSETQKQWLLEIAGMEKNLHHDSHFQWRCLLALFNSGNGTLCLSDIHYENENIKPQNSDKKIVASSISYLYNTRACSFFFKNKFLSLMFRVNVCFKLCKSSVVLPTLGCSVQAIRSLLASSKKWHFSNKKGWTILQVAADCELTPLEWFCNRTASIIPLPYSHCLYISRVSILADLPVQWMCALNCRFS